MNVIDMQSAKEKVDEADTLYWLTDRLFRAQSAEDVYNAALDAITKSLGCESIHSPVRQLWRHALCGVARAYARLSQKT